jgi:hypothetical protein
MNEQHKFKKELQAEILKLRQRYNMQLPVKSIEKEVIPLNTLIIVDD